MGSKWGEKVVVYAITLVMVLSLIYVPNVSSNAETVSGPVLRSVSISNSPVTRPGTVKMVVDVYGKNYGIIRVRYAFSHINSDTYGDEDIVDEINCNQVFDGKITIDINIDKFRRTGEYSLLGIYLTDSAGHESWYSADHDYYADDTFTTLNPEKAYTDAKSGCVIHKKLACKANGGSTNSVTFKVNSSEGIEDVPPRLTSIKALSETVSKPGTIKLELGVEGKSFPIKSVDVRFIYLGGKHVGDEALFTYKDVNISNGTVSLEAPVEANKRSGRYQISSVTLVDASGTRVSYWIEGMYSGVEKSEVDLSNGTYIESSKYYVPWYISNKGVSFKAPIIKVGNDIAEAADPELKGIRMVSNSVKRPGVAQIELDVYGKDYPVKYARVAFGYKGNPNLYDEVLVGDTTLDVPITNGTAKISIPIGENQLLGEYVLIGVSLMDSSEGYNWYYLDNEDNESITDSYSKPCKTVSFNYTETDDYYERLTLSHPDLISRINNVPDGNVIGLYIDNESGGIMPKAVFDAIKGRSITVVAYKDAYQWRFYGKDITKATKDIDLTTQISQVDKSVYNTAEDAVMIVFKSNGELPCKTNIRIKSDYLYDLNGVKGQLYLYYDKNDGSTDNSGIEYQAASKVELSFDGTDKWCDFDITHNSTYVVTGSAIGSGSSSGSGDTSGGESAPSYSNEWVGGYWYNADGSQTYPGVLSWKCNSTGWWVEDTNGWYPYSQWQKIDGYWYYFDASGYMASSEWIGGWWINGDGSCTYGGTASWKCNSSGWYYLDTSGWYPWSQWQKIDGYWYYFNYDGYMVTNQYVDGYWIGADGTCQ